MNPAFSVILLTTLIGAGQGLFIAVVYGHPYNITGSWGFGLVATLISLGLLIAGLLASFFHLGRPERAWRAVTKWRTSWLSREVIVIPVAMIIILIYALMQWKISWFSADYLKWVGWAGVCLMLTLYVCTGMIYACVKFLQEWASPWTLINFALLGIASGFALATALSATFDIAETENFRRLTMIITVAALITRLFSFHRNSRIKYKSTIQSAIGIKHQNVTQRSMGHTGGSFNTRAFFHHCSDALIRNLRLIVVLAVFVVPTVLLLLYAILM
ncbi:MAG: dimethyl sulfoxide reductase anchor subunit family protein, partial [bacterium]